MDTISDIIDYVGSGIGHVSRWIGAPFCGHRWCYDHLHCNLYLSSLSKEEFVKLIKGKLSFSNLPDVSYQRYFETYEKSNYKDYWLSRNIIAIPGAFWHGCIKAPLNLLLCVGLVMTYTICKLLVILPEYFLQYNIMTRLSSLDKQSIINWLYTFVREFQMAGGYLYTLWNDVKGLQYIHRAYLETICYSKKHQLLEILNKDELRDLIIELSNDVNYRADSETEYYFANRLESLVCKFLPTINSLGQENDQTANDVIKIFHDLTEKFPNQKDRDYIFDILINLLNSKLNDFDYKSHKKYFQIYIKAISYRDEGTHHCYSEICNRNPIRYSCFNLDRRHQWNQLIYRMSRDKSIDDKLDEKLDEKQDIPIHDINGILAQLAGCIIESKSRAIYIITDLFNSLIDKEKNSLIDLMRNTPKTEENKDMNEIHKGVLLKIFPNCARYFLKKNEKNILLILCSVQRLKKENKLVLTKDMLVTILSYVITDAKDECQGHPMKLVAGDSGIKNLIKI